MSPVVFFDIGNTLASVAITPANRIGSLAVYPYVPDVLTTLRERGIRLGILSDPGPLPVQEVNRALEDAGLWDFFEPELVIYGPKNSPRIFERAAERAGASARPIFVGEDAGERTQALRAGFQAAPHPLLVVPLTEEGDEGVALRYVRVTLPGAGPAEDRRADLQTVPLLPLHVTGEAATTLYAITTSAGAARLEGLGLGVDLLGAEDEPLTTDLYLLRDAPRPPDGSPAEIADRAAALAPALVEKGLLTSTDEGHFVTVAPGDSIDGRHVPGAQHGHNFKLLPSPALLYAVGPQPEESAELAAALDTTAAATIAPEAREILAARIQPDHVATLVERYSGARPLSPGSAPLRSRHITHPDNAAAVAALEADLQRIGGGRLTVRRHAFTHEGRRLENVEAELPGTGLDGEVLVTAHLDSTAANDPGYRPGSDPAPGADDDASGIAATLLAAEAITALDAELGLPRRCVRFVLFNAEEQGRVGSQDYANDQAVLGTRISAVLQVDMIGYDVRPGRTWELHAGFHASPGVQGRSVAVARAIADVVAQVSPALPAPQIYPADGGQDPAEGRSDHYSFQRLGYAACLASEDFFAGPGPTGPPEDMNPGYHSSADSKINAAYAADIARAVAAAAWAAATR